MSLTGVELSDLLLDAVHVHHCLESNNLVADSWELEGLELFLDGSVVSGNSLDKGVVTITDLTKVLEDGEHVITDGVEGIAVETLDETVEEDWEVVEGGVSEIWWSWGWGDGANGPESKGGVRLTGSCSAGIEVGSACWDGIIEVLHVTDVIEEAPEDSLKTGRVGPLLEGVDQTLNVTETPELFVPSEDGVEVTEEWEDHLWVEVSIDD